MSMKSDIADFAAGIGCGALILCAIYELGWKLILGIMVGVAAFILLVGIEDDTDDSQ